MRRGVGEDIFAGETEADKEIEGWIADVLARKDGKWDLREGVAEKLAELAEIEKRKERKVEEVQRQVMQQAEKRS